MFHLLILFAFASILRNVESTASEEIIEPVDMAYNCIKPDGDEEGQSKSPILLMHGVGGSQKIFSALSILLANHTKREVCAVDFRNHGNSPWNTRNDIEALAVDVGHFLDKQGIKKVNFIGQSLGGKTAIHYTLKYPDRVDSIVVEDIRPNSIPSDATLLVSFFFQVLKGALESVPEGVAEDEAQKSIINFLNNQLEQMGATERLPDHFSDFMEIKLVDGKWRFKYNFDVISESVKNIENVFTESTGLYEGPTMFIYGTKSPFKVYEDKENILKLFPNAEFVAVEGASHMIHGVFKEFDDAVISFLNKLN